MSELIQGLSDPFSAVLFTYVLSSVIMYDLKCQEMAIKGWRSPLLSSYYALILKL